MNPNDQKRLAHVRAHINTGQGIRFKGGTIHASDLGRVLCSLRRGCVFTSDDHSTGHIEHKGKKLTFQVGDDALVVTLTDEPLHPQHVARMRPLVAIEKQRRAAELAANTERHRRWKR